MSGWVAMPRDWQSHHLFEGDVFSRRDAWAWLIANAAWKPTQARIKGGSADLDRGELAFSNRFLAQKWGWSNSRADRFLHELARAGLIDWDAENSAHAGRTQRIITICNYSINYLNPSNRQDNPNRASRSKSGTPAGQTSGRRKAPKKIDSTNCKNSENFQNPANSNQPQWDDHAQNIGTTAGQRRTREQITSSVSKETGSADALPPQTPAQTSPIDLKAAIFQSGLSYLIQTGSSDRNARSLLGKWRSKYGDGAVMDALARAQTEQASAPIPFISKSLESYHASPRNYAPRIDRTSDGFALAAARGLEAVRAGYGFVEPAGAPDDCTGSASLN